MKEACKRRGEAGKWRGRGEQEARKEIYSEAKSVGFDPKIVRKIVAARKKAADARREENELLSLYADAIGQGDLFA